MAARREFKLRPCHATTWVPNHDVAWVKLKGDPCGNMNSAIYQGLRTEPLHKALNSIITNPFARSTAMPLQCHYDITAISWDTIVEAMLRMLRPCTLTLASLCYTFKWHNELQEVFFRIIPTFLHHILFCFPRRQNFRMWYSLNDRSTVSCYLHFGLNLAQSGPFSKQLKVNIFVLFYVERGKVL